MTDVDLLPVCACSLRPAGDVMFYVTRGWRHFRFVIVARLHEQHTSGGQCRWAGSRSRGAKWAGRLSMAGAWRGGATSRTVAGLTRAPAPPTSLPVNHRSRASRCHHWHPWRQWAPDLQCLLDGHQAASSLYHFRSRPHCLHVDKWIKSRSGSGSRSRRFYRSTISANVQKFVIIFTIL